ncbi:hypothetical protein BH11ARM2_BH11ARM2_19800 [soil metagenome]
MVVDGTLVKAWASHKSFKPKDGSGDDKPNFKGGRRTNQTHESTSDADAKLVRKGPGKEAMLCPLGHAPVDSVSGLVRACKVTQASGLGGDAEVVTAIDLAAEHMRKGQTLLADRGYDTKAFVSGVRALGVRAHPRARKSGSRLDKRTTQTRNYQEGIARRHIVEPVFGWIKGPGRIRQTKLRGTEKVGWEFHLYRLAYNLRRMALA